MNKLKLTGIVCAALATLSIERADAGRDWAEHSYKEGLELLEKGQPEQAAYAFAKAIRFRKESKKAPRAKYFVKHCEAVIAGLDNYRSEEWDGLLRICDAAKTAPELRASLAAKLAKLATARGDDEAKGSDHGDAAKWYRLAIAYKSSRALWGKLCQSHVALGSDEAATSCEKAGKKTLAKRAKAKPFGSQKKLIKELEDALSWGGDNVEYMTKCAVAVRAASSAGVPAHQRIEVASSFPNATEVANPGRGPSYFAPLKKVGPYCRARVSELLAAPLAQKLTFISYEFRGIASATRKNELAAISFHVKECRAAIKTALDSGMASSTKLDIGGKKMTAGAVDTKLCTALENAAASRVEELAEKERQAIEAKLAPYRKVLKQDKMRLYADIGVNTWFQGRGGKLLKTPAQLEKARKWFVSSSIRDRETGLMRWSLTIYEFRGHKLKRTRIKEGRGKNPPSKAFR